MQTRSFAVFIYPGNQGRTIDKIETDFDIVILGAGITGLASAFFLSKSGLRVCVIDEYKLPGGNHISRDFNGYTFDIGSILFSSHNPQFGLFPGSFQDFVEFDWTTTRLTPQGDIRPYPLSLRHEVLTRPIVFLRAVASLAYHRLFPWSVANADTYAKFRLGTYLYRRSGLQNYIWRFYGVDPRQINLQFVYRRMNLDDISSIRKFLKNLISHKKVKPAKEPEPVLSLARPRKGFHVYYDRVANFLRSQGVDIRLGATLHGVVNRSGIMSVDTTQGSITAKRVLNSLPLGMITRLAGLPQPQLDTTTLCTLCCSFDGTKRFNNVVLYNFHDDGHWKRITMHSDYYGRHDGREFFNVECTIVASDPDPHSLFKNFVDHAKRVGLFEGDFRLEGHIVLDNAYPICNLQSEERRLKAIDDLAANGIESIGRQGMFDYIPHSSVAIHLVNDRFGGSPSADNERSGSGSEG